MSFLSDLYTTVVVRSAVTCVGFKVTAHLSTMPQINMIPHQVT